MAVSVVGLDRADPAEELLHAQQGVQLLGGSKRSRGIGEHRWVGEHSEQLVEPGRPPRERRPGACAESFGMAIAALAPWLGRTCSNSAASPVVPARAAPSVYTITPLTRCAENAQTAGLSAPSRGPR